MVSTNLSAVRLEGTEYSIRKVMKDLNGRAAVVIRGGKGLLYVGVPSIELGWLDKLVKDIGVKKHEIQSLPEHKIAPCGAHVIHLKQHTGRCKACARLRPAGGPSKATKAETVAVIEPGQDFNLDGVIASLEITRERIYEQLEKLEALIGNLKGFREARDKLTGLEKEAKDRMQAAKMLLNEGRYQ